MKQIGRHVLTVEKKCFKLKITMKKVDLSRISVSPTGIDFIVDGKYFITPVLRFAKASVANRDIETLNAILQYYEKQILIVL